MTRFISWALVSVAVLCVSQVSGFYNETRVFDRRQTTGNGWDLDNKSYDYVIVGGGTAGLVLANRLSADGSNSVAVIEAGNSGYDDNNKFIVPSAMLYDSGTNTQYDWQFKTTAQKHMNGRKAAWPRGKVLGGSSAINGLYYVRPSDAEMNAWADLAGGNAYDHWGWDSFFRYFKRSEKFQTPLKSVQDQAHIHYDDGSHGHHGPIHTTWPAITYGPVGAFIESANKAGVKMNKNGYDGKNQGVYLALSSLNKDNWQRSFSRNEYLDPIGDRKNLHVLTGHTVTQILFDRSDKNNVQATGVHYKAAANEYEHTLHANKEVILSAGSINSPQLLQLSGVGPSGLLQSLGIDVVVDLPGVGENLQDHVMAGMSFSVKNDKDVPPQKVTGNKKTDSYVNSAVSYVAFHNIFNDADAFRGKIQARVKAIPDELNVDDSVREGYRAVYDKIANDLFYSNVSPVEVLGNVMFGSISLQAALQHPLSRGNIRITSKNPFDYPRINPNYFREDIDLKILREAFKLIREITQQPPLKDHIASENWPGNGVQSNEQWEDWIRNAAGTEYHPSSTCAMLPRNKGGVVNPDLKVYGTRNLRVVDASVPPLALSCHLESVVYALAEAAAEIILNHN